MSGPPVGLARVGVVVIEDRGVDACLIERDNREGVLILRPHQGFGSAVRAVQSLLPRTPNDDVRRLVRTHLPNAPDLDGMLDLEHGHVDTWRFASRLPLMVASMLLTLLSVGFYTLHEGDNFDPDGRRDPTPEQVADHIEDVLGNPGPNTTN